MVLGLMHRFSLDRLDTVDRRINDILMLIDDGVGMGLSELIDLVTGALCLFKRVDGGLFAVLRGNWIIRVCNSNLLKGILKLVVDFLFLLSW